MKKTIKVLIAAILIAGGTGGVARAVDTTFSQTINSGTLSVDILDENQQTVATPGVTMSAINTSTSCATPGSTGTLGTNTQRVYVDNPEAANNGWTLSIAATGGPTANWTDGTNTLAFNDPANGGCNNGQLSIDPSAGSVTTDCQSCGSTGITTGAAASFSNGVVDSIELVNAANTSDNIWRGYLSGAAVSQVIPAEQPVGAYALDMTLTVVAD